MKHLISIFIFLLGSHALCCEVSVLNSCRDSYTKHLSKNRTKRSVRSVKRDPVLQNQLDKIFNELTTNTTHKDLIRDLLKIRKLNEAYKECVEMEESTELTCLRQSIDTSIYYGYGSGKLDATAAIIILSKLSSSRRASYTGELNTYAQKIKLLARSYSSRQETFSAESPLSQKKYLKKYGRLRRLTPRQALVFKYNYSQIKHLGKIMQKFEQRIISSSAGLFYDYDGDGVADENYVLDEAEKYRMTVKLLKLELEKLSHSGEIFQGNKPDFHDLLAASNELGLISDKDLQSMVELPYLYEPGPNPWATAGRITWEIAQGVVSVIPGVNLYAIIPIILVESYLTSREQENETSDLHLFTF